MATKESGSDVARARTDDPTSPAHGKRELGWLAVFGLVGGFLVTFSMGTFVLALNAGGLDAASPVPAGGGDAVALLAGERIYTTQCARCHGANGEGGIGVRIGGGAVVEKYPDIADQLRIIAEGRGTMPGFATTLTPAEIEAVAQYERERLGR